MLKKIIFFLLILTCSAYAGTYVQTVSTANYALTANYATSSLTSTTANYALTANAISGVTATGIVTTNFTGTVVSLNSGLTINALTTSRIWNKGITTLSSDLETQRIYAYNNAVFNNPVSISATLKALNTSVNALDINSDITYKDTYWDDMTTDLIRGTKIGVTDPNWGAWAGGNLYTYHFDDTRDEELAFTIQMSHRYKTGTTCNIHVHYSPDTTNTGNVVWGVGYTISTINGTFTTETVVTASSTIATDSRYKHLLCDIATLPAQGTVAGNAVSWIIFGRVFRKGSDPNDTLVGDCSGLSIDVHYEVDSPGSRQQIIK